MNLNEILELNVISLVHILFLLLQRVLSKLKIRGSLEFIKGIYISQKSKKF